jgi:thiamine kinase-like enzyme
MKGLESLVRKYVAQRPEVLGFTSDKPVPVRMLPRTSHSHVNFVAGRPGKRVVIRVSVRSAKKHAHLSDEYRVLKAIESYGIAPRPVAFVRNSLVGEPFLVVEYIEGNHISHLTDARLKELARLMSHIHRIKPGRLGNLRDRTSKRIVLASAEVWARELPLYFKDTKGKEFASVLSYIYDSILRSDNGLRYMMRLVHLDVAFENILVSKGRLMLIDWERSCISDPYYDIASMVDRLSLNDRQIDLFLKEYGSSGMRASRKRLDAFMKILLLDRMLWAVTEAKRIKLNLKGPNFSKSISWQDYERIARGKFFKLRRFGAVPEGLKWLPAREW